MSLEASASQTYGSICLSTLSLAERIKWLDQFAHDAFHLRSGACLTLITAWEIGVVGLSRLCGLTTFVFVLLDGSGTESHQESKFPARSAFDPKGTVIKIRGV